MKKVLSIILAALMLLAMVPAVYAATPAISTTVNKTSVSVGDIVTLTAAVPANSKLCVLEYEIYYDTSAFQVVSNSGLCKGVFESESFSSTTGKIKYSGSTSTVISNSKRDFFTIQFKALKSSGTISVAVVEAYTPNGTSETNITSAVNSVSAKTFTFSASSTGYLNMRTPSRTTIRYKDGIVLHADPLKVLPDGSKIVWSASNGNFKSTPSVEGKSLTIVSDAKGDTVFTATLYNSRNVEIDSVSIVMTSKAGFFDKIGGFFRSLFGTTKIYSE